MVTVDGTNPTKIPLRRYKGASWFMGWSAGSTYARLLDWYQMEERRQPFCVACPNVSCRVGLHALAPTAPPSPPAAARDEAATR